MSTVQHFRDAADESSYVRAVRIRRLIGMLMVVPATFLIAFAWRPYREESTLRETGRLVRATVLSTTEAPSDGMNDFSVSGTDEIRLRLRYEVDGVSYEANEPPLDHLGYDGTGSIDVVYDPAAPRVHSVVGAGPVNLALVAVELVGGLMLYLVAAVRLGDLLAMVRRLAGRKRLVGTA